MLGKGDLITVALCGERFDFILRPPLPLPFVSLTLRSTQQLRDDDIQPLGANLGRFKRLKEIKMVSRGMP